MKVKKLYLADRFPYHMVLETLGGEFKMFRITPARQLREDDLKPVPHFQPVGRGREEASQMLYRMFGLEKEDGHGD